MAKVGSLNLIKQFSSAQGEDKQVCFPHRAAPNSIVLLIARISLFGVFAAMGVHINKSIASAVQERVDRSLRQEKKEMKEKAFSKFQISNRIGLYTRTRLLLNARSR